MFKGRGRISFKNSGNYYEANSTSPVDLDAKQRNYDFVLGWFGGCWTDGDYPQTIKDTLGDLLPTFTEEEKALIKGSCDFFAIDPYTSYYAYEIEGGVESCISNSSHPGFPECAGSVSTEPNGFPVGPAADPGVNWLYDTPTGVRRFLKEITQVLFPSVPDIFVTEFGFAEPFEGEMTTTNQILWDLRRADYYQSFLDNILASIHIDSVNVTGAYGWAICKSPFPGGSPPHSATTDTDILFQLTISNGLQGQASSSGYNMSTTPAWNEFRKLAPFNLLSGLGKLHMLWDFAS